MHRRKHLAILLADTLQSTGLHCLMEHYFSPAEVACFPSFEALVAVADRFDLYFTHPETFALNPDFFLPRRNKTVLVTNSTDGTRPQSPVAYLSCQAPVETLIEQLEGLLSTDSPTTSTAENSKELSAREMDVLQQIVRGITNKEVADRLNISLNTVLTHRKNITSKLGIKTLSGLTFYAIMNGIVAGDNIEL